MLLTLFFHCCTAYAQVLTAIGNFCICSIAVGMVIEIIVMYPIQHRKYRPGIDNLLVLLIGGIPIAMPTVLSVTMAIGSHRLAQQVFLILLGFIYWFGWFVVYRTFHNTMVHTGCYNEENDCYRRDGGNGCALQRQDRDAYAEQTYCR